MNIDRRNNLITMYFSKKNDQRIVTKASTSTTAAKVTNNAEAAASVGTRSRSTAQTLISPQTSASLVTVGPVAAGKITNRRPTHLGSTSRATPPMNAQTAGKITRRRPTRTMRAAEHFNFSNQCCIICNNWFMATTGIVLCDICRRRLE